MVTDQAVLPEDISSLTNLKELHVRCGRILCDFNWGALELLEIVHLCGAIESPLPLHGLLQLKKLRGITISGSESKDREKVKQLADFISMLPIHRPDVVFSNCVVSQGNTQELGQGLALEPT